MLSISDELNIDVPKDISLCEEPDRWIPAHWVANQKTTFLASLQITAIDRQGMILDVSQTLLNMRVSLNSMNARSTKDGNCVISITVTTEGLEHLKSIIARIEKIHGVFHVERTNQ